MTAALLAAPDETWQARIVARPRRTAGRIGAGPGAGMDGARAPSRVGRVADAVRTARDGRTMTNGLLSVSVADDGTLRLEAADGTAVEGVGPDRRRR